MSKYIKNLNIPKIGEYYHFWDDGKTSMSRHYICKCERIIVPSQAKCIKVKVPIWDYDENVNNFAETNVYDAWKAEVECCDWLYAENTDYLIECSCPNYDENNIWFARTKDNNWFSFNIQNSWQSGLLDLDGKIFENRVNECIKDGGDPSGYYEAKYEKTKHLENS